jgi:hypothetical protein
MSSFPKARSYAAAVKAKQKGLIKVATDQQLNTISRLLTKFDEKCNIDGIVEVDVNVIGDFIHDENITVIQKSGWQFHKREGKWQFYIAEKSR